MINEVKDQEIKKNAVVIAVYNNKGGIGKTSFVTNFLSSLVTDFKKEDGTPYKCLCIDNDGQSNASLILTQQSEDVIAETYDNTMFELMTDEDVKAIDCIIPTKYSNIDIIPATDDHSDTPDAIASNPDSSRILKKKIQSIKEFYDIIVIDCAPTRDRNIYNALFSSDIVISPVDTQIFSRVGLRNLLKQVNKINKMREKPLLHYVFLNKVDNRQTNINAKVKENLKNVLGDDLIESYLSLLTGIYSKASEQGYTVVNYPGDNRAGLEIKDLTQKILEKIREELGGI